MHERIVRVKYADNTYSLELIFSAKVHIESQNMSSFMMSYALSWMFGGDESEANKEETGDDKKQVDESEDEDIYAAGGYESSSSSGSEYLPHDHGLYGPTSKAIFKKQYEEQKFGLFKKPRINTPSIKVKIRRVPTYLCVKNYLQSFLAIKDLI